MKFSTKLNIVKDGLMKILRRGPNLVNEFLSFWICSWIFFFLLLFSPWFPYSKTEKNNISTTFNNGQIRLMINVIMFKWRFDVASCSLRCFCIHKKKWKKITRHNPTSVFFQKSFYQWIRSLETYWKSKLERRWRTNTNIAVKTDSICIKQRADVLTINGQPAAKVDNQIKNTPIK